VVEVAAVEAEAEIAGRKWKGSVMQAVLKTTTRF